MVEHDWRFDRIIKDDNRKTGHTSKIWRNSYGSRVRIALVGIALYVNLTAVQSVSDTLLVNQIHKVVRWGRSKLATIKERTSLWLLDLQQPTI